MSAKEPRKILKFVEDFTTYLVKNGSRERGS